MSQRKSLLLRLLAVLVAFVMLTAACSGDDADDAGDGGSDSSDSGGSADDGDNGDVSEVETEEAPDETGLELVRGGEISVGIVAESPGFFPPTSELALAGGYLVIDALYDKWYVQKGDGSLVPMLAAGPAVPNEDGTQWTMTIREGINFHDGRPLNAQAAVDMLTIWQEGPFSDSITASHAEVVDEYTVTYFFDEPSPAFEQLMSGYFGNAFSPDAARGFGIEASAENPVGTGPFMLESWTRDSETVVVRNPNYWRTAPDGGTLPYLDRIRFRILPDGTSRRAALEAGDIHVMSQPGVDGAAPLVEQGFVPYEYLGNGAGLSIYNTAVPPFDDVRVRRAAAHAINLEDHVALRPPNLASVLEVKTQYYNSASPWYDEEAHGLAATYDLAAAQAEYEAYVNDPERSDGKAVGEPISFTYDCTTDPVNLDTTLLFQQQWQDIGFEVELRTSESTAFIAQVLGITSDPPLQGDFQIACWADGPGGDPSPLYEARYTDRVENWTNFTDPEIDAAIDGLRNTLVFEERKEFAGQIARITAAQQTEFWWPAASSLVLTVPEIRGVETNTFPDGEPGDRRPASRVWWTEVWVDGAEPQDGLPTDYISTPEPPEEPELGGPNPDIAALMPAAPEGFSVLNQDAQASSICDGVDPIGSVQPISATYQTYAIDPALGPFGLISIFELEEGDAQAVVDAYAAAVATCTDFTTTTADGTTLTGDFIERDFGSFGSESYSYGMPSNAGIPLDFDFVIIREGNNLAVVVVTTVFAASDGSAVPLFAAPAAEILAALG